MATTFNQCPTCKRWGYLDTHACGPSFMVRVDGSDPRRVYGRDAEDAAERYCDEFDAEVHEYDIIAHGSAVLIVTSDKGDECTVDIEAERVPQYRARIRS